MSFPGDNRSAYYAGGNPPPQLMQGQPRAMQGMQQGLMPPLYAGNQVSTLTSTLHIQIHVIVIFAELPLSGGSYPPVRCPPRRSRSGARHADGHAAAGDEHAAGAARD
jgi:hypothetical protein